MTPFASDQWIIIALVFVLGLVLGMYFLSGGKWKRRYREESRTRAEIEAREREAIARADAAEAREAKWQAREAELKARDVPPKV